MAGVGGFWAGARRAEMHGWGSSQFNQTKGLLAADVFKSRYDKMEGGGLYGAGIDFGLGVVMRGAEVDEGGGDGPIWYHFSRFGVLMRGWKLRCGGSRPGGTGLGWWWMALRP